MTPILYDFPDHFETERLLVRAPQHGDGAALCEAVVESLRELKPWMPWAHQEISVEAEEAIVRRMRANFSTREDLPLFLFRRDNGKFIGGSGLHHIDWSVPRFEIGYWVRTSQRGKGFITEAAHGIARFAFETLTAERVEIRMDDRNERSWRVAERLGFTLEGLLRHDARGIQGELRDTRVYAMLRRQWLARPGTAPPSGVKSTQRKKFKRDPQRR